MAYCQIFEHPDLTPEKMEQVMAHVRTTGPVLPEGARLMVAGPGDPGGRVITIWDSNEARERFLSERLSEAYIQAGLSLDSANVTVFEVSKLAAGDLTGTPQPA
jgi:hypothetical protein